MENMESQSLLENDEEQDEDEDNEA
jgi:hypothetical protein